ncbi:MAG: lytic transglycosylase domain-containing protein [Nitrosomonas sp.]|nr:lytic transglycosylase domain-containing protein [Nitrosomonas sp.]
MSMESLPKSNAPINDPWLDKIITYSSGILNKMRIFLLATLLLFTFGAFASEISVPMKLDYRFLHRILLEQVYTAGGNKALLIDDKASCSKLVLSDPQISHDEGRIRTVSTVNAMFGRKIAGRCIKTPEWRGLIEIFQQPAIVTGQPVIEFQVVDSNLLNKGGEKPLLTGALWDLVMQHVHSSLGALRVDLAVPLKDIQTFVPLLLTTSGSDIANRTLESVMFSGVEATNTGIVLTLQFQVPDKDTDQSVNFSTEPPLTTAEALRWESAWQRWDAFLTFVVKQVAEDNEQGNLRKELLQVLLDGRYDLSEALTSWNGGAVDPVRGLFLKSWRRLSPILRQMETTLPGTAAIRYLSFVTAADALTAMDQMSEQIGYEISADGLRRMARMLSPGFEEDPLIYRLDVDMELRKLFDFGPPLPAPSQAPDINSGTWFFFARAWAADKPEIALIKKLNGWAPDTSDIESYLPVVGDLLDYVADKTISSKHLPEGYHNFFRDLALATAWQESCWRQFVKKNGQLEPLMSPGGSIGIMQINPSVWRGFYDLSSLRNDVSYNAMAGNEILHHYFTDHVLPKSENQEKRNFDSLARLTYATYSAGPGFLYRYRNGSISKDIHEIATTFWEKYHAMKTSGPSAVASCYGLP